MRPVPVLTKEKLGEGGWVIAAAETIINPVFAEEVLEHITAKKTGDLGKMGSLLGKAE
jgi:hypothetical protein